MVANQAGPLVAKGALFVGVLVEDAGNGGPASKTQLDAWVGSAKAWHTYTLDASSPLMILFNRPREYAIIVDLTTMKIVEIKNDINAVLSDLAALL